MVTGSAFIFSKRLSRDVPVIVKTDSGLLMV